MRSSRARNARRNFEHLKGWWGLACSMLDPTVCGGVVFRYLQDRGIRGGSLQPFRLLECCGLLGGVRAPQFWSPPARLRGVGFCSRIA